MADEKPPSPGNAPTSQPVPAGAVTAEPMNVPPISLDPPPASKKAPPAATPAVPAKKAEQKDTAREVLETIVFVVVLVLMLKTFLAEAFVIPTGSMADTLLGYHYKVTCESCGMEILVNASSEAEAIDPRRVPRITTCQCKNCGKLNSILKRGRFVQDQLKFFDETKEVGPNMSWNQEVKLKAGGRVSFRITSQGPFSIMVVAGKEFQAGQRPAAANILLETDSKKAEYEGQVEVPAGSSWFVIQNLTDKKADIRLECAP